MSNLQFSSDILDDMLFRAGEPTDGTSEFESKALESLNRAYQALWMGGTELDPTINEDWWWLLADPPLVLTLEPVITSGTVSVANNNLTATFSGTPAPLIDSDVTNWFLKIDGHPDVFRVSSISTATATLDSVYTGATDTEATYKLMKLEYSLNSAVLRVTGPMRVFAESRDRIDGMAILELEEKYPLRLVSSGVPRNFAHLTETKVRMSHYGFTSSTGLIRVEYHFLEKPSLLTDSGSEEPVVPWQYRKNLADWALWFLQADKNDSKAASTFALAKSGLHGMAVEQRHKMATQGNNMGKIITRPDQEHQSLNVVRTESGLILG